MIDFNFLMIHFIHLVKQLVPSSNTGHCMTNFVSSDGSFCVSYPSVTPSKYLNSSIYVRYLSSTLSFFSLVNSACLTSMIRALMKLSEPMSPNKVKCSSLEPSYCCLSYYVNSRTAYGVFSRVRFYEDFRIDDKVPLFSKDKSIKVRLKPIRIAVVKCTRVASVSVRMVIHSFSRFSNLPMASIKAL